MITCAAEHGCDGTGFIREQEAVKYTKNYVIYFLVAFFAFFLLGDFVHFPLTQPNITQSNDNNKISSRKL